VGENHLIEEVSKFIKAVSERLFSAAIFCIKDASLRSENITAAGLPENKLLVKAST
jgi:hypothetical protein